MAQTIERLQEIIDNPNSKKQMVDIAKAELERLTRVGSAEIKLASAMGGSDDPALSGILNALQTLVTSGVGGGGSSVNSSQVRDLVLQELATRKIELNDLSVQLKAWLQSLRSTTLTIDALGIINTRQVSGNPMLSRRLTQLILSDIAAKNNVYLYGGAGTGKTFIAGYIAEELMGYKLVTLNCNQYTSPLDIIGGQTIDGYQEGKLSMAWSNTLVDRFGVETKVDGCVLLLDELPKIDPNTAGILNEALAKVKQYKYNDKTKTLIPPKILNGRNEELTLGNMIVIATGNVPLNTIDPDYEANFKQDLSLQDRFIGSTYKVFVDYKNEFENVMYGYAFIWLFGVKLREAIVEFKATSQAFVSLRLMENLKSTYKVYRDVVAQNKNTKASSLISQPKTLIEALETFFTLFKPSQRDSIMEKVDFKGFKRIVAEKDKMPYNKEAPNFDTPQEIQEGNAIVDRYEREQANQI